MSTREYLLANANRFPLTHGTATARQIADHLSGLKDSVDFDIETGFPGERIYIEEIAPLHVFNDKAPETLFCIDVGVGTHSFLIERVRTPEGRIAYVVYQSWLGRFDLSWWLGKDNACNRSVEPRDREARRQFGKARLLSRSDAEKLLVELISIEGRSSGRKQVTIGGAFRPTGTGFAKKEGDEWPRPHHLSCASRIESTEGRCREKRSGAATLSMLGVCVPGAVKPAIRFKEIGYTLEPFLHQVATNSLFNDKSRATLFCLQLGDGRHSFLMEKVLNASDEYEYLVYQAWDRKFAQGWWYGSNEESDLGAESDFFSKLRADFGRLKKLNRSQAEEFLSIVSGRLDLPLNIAHMYEPVTTSQFVEYADQ